MASRRVSTELVASSRIKILGSLRSALAIVINCFSPLEILDEEGIKERYELSSAMQMIDYLGLMGDAADNIPGSALGNITLNVVCVLLAPSANEASR